MADEIRVKHVPFFFLLRFAHYTEFARYVLLIIIRKSITDGIANLSLFTTACNYACYLTSRSMILIQIIAILLG